MWGLNTAVTENSEFGFGELKIAQLNEPFVCLPSNLAEKTADKGVLLPLETQATQENTSENTFCKTVFSPYPPSFIQVSQNLVHIHHWYKIIAACITKTVKKYHLNLDKTSVKQENTVLIQCGCQCHILHICIINEITALCFDVKEFPLSAFFEMFIKRCCGMLWQGGCHLCQLLSTSCTAGLLLAPTSSLQEKEKK